MPSCALRSLFISTWVNVVIHDWFFHEFTDEEPWTLKHGPGEGDTFKLRRTIIDENGHALNTETPWWEFSACCAACTACVYSGHNQQALCGLEAFSN